MKIRKTALYKGVIVFTIGLLLLISSAFGYKNACRPFKDYTTVSSVFCMSSQLLCPSITYSTIQLYPSVNPLKEDKLVFYLDRFSYTATAEESRNTGKIQWKWGAPRLSEYDNRLNMDSLITTQAVFMQEGASGGEPLDMAGEDYYMVWYRFERPMTAIEFSDAYAFLIEDTVSRPNRCGVVWIPVRTSDNAEDICLGMAGNYSWHYMNTVYSASRYDQDAYEREISFVQSLQYLSDQQPLATLLLNSGPFEMEEAVDFGKRLDYVNTNGVLCLGMCVYIPGTVARELADEDGVALVRYFPA